MRELETELTETQIKLRAYKKARDELDVLREGQEKNSRLESELHRLKTKLEEAEHVYERVEVLEVENRWVMCSAHINTIITFVLWCSSSS